MRIKRGEHFTSYCRSFTSEPKNLSAPHRPTASCCRIVSPSARTGGKGRHAFAGSAQGDLGRPRAARLRQPRNGVGNSDSQTGFSLQVRGDFFRILNHPNFGSPINYLTFRQFGYATQMLNNYFGSGGQSSGLNPLYQIGGPRSIQLALKLQF
jgi:hypothetical protein